MEGFTDKETHLLHMQVGIAGGNEREYHFVT